MRVVIVDDDQLVALSLKTILEANEEISVVGTGNDGTEAVVLYEKELSLIHISEPTRRS